MGIDELATVAGPSKMPSLMRSAASLLQQTLPGARASQGDMMTELIDDEAINAEAYEKLETAVEALGSYMNAVKESRPAKPLPELIEKLTTAQARFNTLVDATVREARALAPAPAAPAPSAAVPARSARSPAAAATSASPAARSSRSSTAAATPPPSAKAAGKKRAR